MLVPVHYREYKYGLLVFIKSLLGEFEMSLTYNASSGKIPKKATEKETVNLQEPISSKQLNMPEFQSLRTWVCCTITVVPGSAVTTCAMLRWSCYKLCSVYLA